MKKSIALVSLCAMVLVLTVAVSNPARKAQAGGITPIANARSLPTGTIITIAGTVTVGSTNNPLGGNFMVQDATAGIVVTTYSGAPTLAEGDSVTAIGDVVTNGQYRVIYAAVITKTGTGTPITPAAIDTKDASKHLGQLVKFSATVVSARNYQSVDFITDVTKTVKVKKGGTKTVIDPNHGLVVIANQIGLEYYPLADDKVCVTGVLDNFYTDYGRYPQTTFPTILPRSTADLKESAC